MSLASQLAAVVSTVYRMGASHPTLAIPSRGELAALITQELEPSDAQFRKLYLALANSNRVLKFIATHGCLAPDASTRAGGSQFPNGEVVAKCVEDNSVLLTQLEKDRYGPITDSD